MSDDLVARLRSSVEGADDWYAIERAFTDKVADDEIDPALGGLRLGYMLVGPGNEESRARNGVFAPRIEWEGGNAFPPRLDDVTAETRDEWLRLYEMLDEHSTRSRLGDLIWITRHGRQPNVAARAAAASYIALVDDPSWSLMGRVDSAARALELTAELNDRSLQQEAIEASVRLVRADRVDLRVEQVQRWRDAAEQATGLTRLAHLRRALELARATTQREVAKRDRTRDRTDLSRGPRPQDAAGLDSRFTRRHRQSRVELHRAGERHTRPGALRS